MLITIALAIASPCLQEAPAADTPRARRQIVHLESGQILRGLTRKDALGDLMFKRDGEWVPVPAASVRSVALEKAVLDEFKARRRDDALAPADKLEWGLDQGLYQEAFTLGDRLLDAHPHDLDLRGLAAARGAKFAGMPKRGAEGELEALLALGSKTSGQGGGSPMIREALLERFALAAPRAELLSRIQGDLQSKHTGERSFALFVQGRLFPKEDPRGLLLHSIYDPSPDGRKMAARAVGDIGAEVVGMPLIKGMYADSAKVRQRAAEAIGYTGDESYVEPLMDRLLMLSAPLPPGGTASRVPHSYIFVGTQTAYVQDFDVEVASGSSVADPVINVYTQGAVLDVGIIGILDVTIITERRVVRGALKRLTGQNPGTKTAQWEKWWESDASKRFRELSPESPAR